MADRSLWRVSLAHSALEVSRPWSVRTVLAKARSSRSWLECNRSAVVTSPIPNQSVAVSPICLSSPELDRDYPVTVAELVALGAWRSMGAFRPLAKNLFPSIDRAIAQVGLEGFADRLIAELSAGQFRRALFARLIVQDASLILLDEPFAAIDEDTTAELLQLIKSWHGEKRTIIAVMHDLDQVRAYFPSTLLLARRCIAWADTETGAVRR